MRGCAGACESSVGDRFELMPPRLSREESIAAFEALWAGLDTVRKSDHHKARQFIAASDEIRRLTDRGSLLIPSVPLSVDLASIWRYQDRGILPEDGGAPIFAFTRRLGHYQDAAKRILDILRDDLLWKLHQAPPLSIPAAPARSSDPRPNPYARQYGILLELMQPLLRLHEWSNRYIELLGDDAGEKSKIARSSHLGHFKSAGSELQVLWTRNEPAVLDARVRDAFRAQQRRRSATASPV